MRENQSRGDDKSGNPVTHWSCNINQWVHAGLNLDQIISNKDVNLCTGTPVETAKTFLTI